MRRIALLLALCLSAGALAADGFGPIKVVTEEWADATNADGTGLYFEILEAVFAEIGGTLDIQIMPYSRSVDTVQNKRADLVIGLYEDEAGSVIYPTHHIDADDVSALYLESRFPAFAGEETIRGKQAIWMRGYAYDEYLSVPVRYVEVDRRDTAINMIIARRADFFLDAAADIESAMEELPSASGDLAVASVLELPIYVCFADTANGRFLAEVWDEIFGELLSSGVIAELFEEWEFGEYEE